MGDSTRLDQLALHCVPGIGSVTIRQLISHFGNARATWQASKKQILAVRGIGPFTYDLLNNKERCFQEAENILKTSLVSNTRLLFHTDPGFPQRLKHIPDAPSLLFFQGTTDLNADRIVAVVGTRDSTAYGREITHKLILNLKSYTPLIISGLAFGIDIAAHRAAMNNTLPTVAVMAGGLDRVYPSAHRPDARQMLKNGGVLSEHPNHIKPEAFNFPSRNRIIAGMCDGVVVVEAGAKGGAQITARLANDYDREVFAVPGSLTSKRSEGCNNLIKQNRAHLITSAHDIAYLLHWTEDPYPALKPLPENLTVTERRIMAVLTDHENGLPLDRLTWAANLTIHEAALALVNLECHQLVKSLPGNTYKRSG